jgi:quinol monooxygenase YgiN
MYAVVYHVDVKPDWTGDVEAELDQLAETTKVAPGFVRASWASDGKTGLSFIVMADEQSARAIANTDGVPPEASVEFRSVEVLEIARDI